jgi:phage shock protein C
MRHDRNWRVQRFYRDPRHGNLMGVCAGVADYFEWNVTAIRILAIVALLWFNGLTVMAYLLLGFMLPIRPDMPCDWVADEEYWRSMRYSTGATFRDGRHRFREQNMNLQHMEGYVTSSRYELDRQFRDLEH